MKMKNFFKREKQNPSKQLDELMKSYHELTMEFIGVYDEVIEVIAQYTKGLEKLDTRIFKGESENENV